ncbi:MAG: phosphoribosylanthranilate isomerase [Lachnospiraceae bacterium]|nr:phosphoribosylanthranilate isomerase [Lachnospiraceae bacterium]
MTKVKFCGITREQDIEVINHLKPDYIGFVFAKKSKRFIDKEKAEVLKEKLNPAIKAVGVFVDEDVNAVAEFLNEGIIDVAQLHGNEDEEYIGQLRKLTRINYAAKFCGFDEEAEIATLLEPINCYIIKAFQIKSEADLQAAEKSTADMILLDAGKGEGKTFEWNLLKGFKRDYFLAGGLDTDNVTEALKRLNPYGLDVSSGIERDGVKDEALMENFISVVR